MTTTDAAPDTAEQAPPRTFADVSALLAARLPGYSPRVGQTQLAETIERMIAYDTGRRARNAELDDNEDDDPQELPTALLAGAPTGSGKSFAGLVPAILSGQRTVFSVTTRMLQGQVGGKDLPFLEKLLGDAGHRFTWTVLKGRSNYWCLSAATSSTEDTPSLERVAQYAESHPDWDGTMEALPFKVYGSEWAQMASDGDTCREAGCRKLSTATSGTCYASRAQHRASNSDVIVTNHALLTIDLFLRSRNVGGMLGAYDLLIVDEAHKFADVARDNLGHKLTGRSFTSAASAASKWMSRYVLADEADLLGEMNRWSDLTERLTEAASALFGPAGLPAGVVREATLSENLEFISALHIALRALTNAWDKVTMQHVATEHYTEARNSRRRITSQLDHLTEGFDQLFNGDPDLVRQVDVQAARGRFPETRTALIRPVSVAAFLSRFLFDRTGVVLMSATLAVGGKMDYVAGELGITRHVDLHTASPFDFRQQGRIYVPTGIPAPKGRDIPAWEAAANEQIIELIRAAGGRTLVLFPSLAHLDRCVRAVRPHIPHTLLVQGEDSVAELARRFAADETSVLFGSSSFGTGTDFAGRALEMLIVAKIPFPVPSDPMFEARAEKIKARGGSDFMGLSVPMASLDLQQWVGRLVRTTTDTGVVAILDPRMQTMGYGRTLLADLPPMPLITSLPVVAAFLEGVAR